MAINFYKSIYIPRKVDEQYIKIGFQENLYINKFVNYYFDEWGVLGKHRDYMKGTTYETALLKIVQKFTQEDFMFVCDLIRFGLQNNKQVINDTEKNYVQSIEDMLFKNANINIKQKWRLVMNMLDVMEMTV